MNHDDLTLSAHSLAALREFLAEQEELKKRLDEKTADIEAYPEDWQLSQFYYDTPTKNIFARECLSMMRNGLNIAIVSAPSVFLQLQNDFKDELKKFDQVKLSLFEYDRRFENIDLTGPSEFIFYDYKYPTRIPGSCAGVYDFFLIDPPFLAEECFRKVSETVRYLRRDQNSKIVVCSGLVMGSLIRELWSCKMSKFVPGHAKRLSNDFKCYTNYDSSHLLQ